MLISVQDSRDVLCKYMNISVLASAISQNELEDFGVLDIGKKKKSNILHPHLMLLFCSLNPPQNKPYSGTLSLLKRAQ